jgi:hypothetical protein
VDSRECLEERQHRAEPLVDPANGVRKADHLGDLLRIDGAALLPFENARELGAGFVGRVGVVEPDRALHGLEERPVRDPFPVREAASGCDERVFAEALQELVHEPRLADTRDAEHGEELAGSVADRLVERVVQAPAFSLSPDHRRIKRADAFGCDVGDVKHTPAVAHRLCRHAIPQNRAGGRVNQDLARRCAVGEPRRNGERFAGCPRLGRRAASGDYLTGADPDAKVEAESALGAEGSR